MTPGTITIDAPLVWPEVAEIAGSGARLELSASAKARIEAANAIVRALIARNIPAYGVNTGVGALSSVAIPPDRQAALSRNILMSHAVGVGTPLGVAETRAIMAAAIANFAHGHSGLRLVTVERLVHLLNEDCVPEVPHQGSVGYLSHMAHIALVLIGQGHAMLCGERLTGAEALAKLGLEPLVLEAKEGLCLVNGTPCVTGLACLALERAARLADWADAIAAMSFETQGGQFSGITSPAMALRTSPGMDHVVKSLGKYLEGSGILAGTKGRKLQDPLSLRAIPHVHGAVRDVLSEVAVTVDRELASVTDNPIVAGSPEAPEVFSQAHAVGAGIGLAMDSLAVALAELGAISERRIDRMVNPLVSGLPAFLASGSGVASGFMIAQYTAVSLTSENRRLAAPASLDGGITSALQEDILCHATPAALKALSILDNLRHILAIEWLAACQAYDLLEGGAEPAPATAARYRRLRATIPGYADDRPLGEDVAGAARVIAAHGPGLHVTE